MKAALLAVLMGIAGAAPLSAQDSPAPAAAPAPGPIVLVTGPDALLAKHSREPLNPEEPLCLGPDDEAVLASDRVTFVLTGEACFTASVAEREAFEAELRALEDEALGLVIEESDAAFASSDPSATDQAFETAETETQDAPDNARAEKEALAAAMSERSDARAERERDPAIEERRLQAAMAERASSNRVRTGALRGGPGPSVPPRPIIFRLASASPPVLQRYPRGTMVQHSTALCLAQGEQATISASNGQSVTYTGPGCLKRQAKPTSTNLGGFTFG